MLYEPYIAYPEEKRHKSKCDVFQESGLNIFFFYINHYIEIKKQK